MKMIHVRRFGFAVVTALGAVILTSPGAAADALQGKTISWTIPFSEGGGSGRWARYMVPLMQRHTGATVQLKFVPGGGGTKGSNLYASRAKANSSRPFAWTVVTWPH